MQLLTVSLFSKSDQNGPEQWLEASRLSMQNHLSTFWCIQQHQYMPTFSEASTNLIGSKITKVIQKYYNCNRASIRYCTTTIIEKKIRSSSLDITRQWDYKDGWYRIEILTLYRLLLQLALDGRIAIGSSMPYLFYLQFLT